MTTGRINQVTILTGTGQAGRKRRGPPESPQRKVRVVAGWGAGRNRHPARMLVGARSHRRTPKPSICPHWISQRVVRHRTTWGSEDPPTACNIHTFRWRVPVTRHVASDGYGVRITSKCLKITMTIGQSSTDSCTAPERMPKGLRSLPYRKLLGSRGDISNSEGKGTLDRTPRSEVCCIASLRKTRPTVNNRTAWIRRANGERRSTRWNLL